MAHEIIFDEIRQINPMAFTGETPWHGLGQQLDPSAPLTEWAKAAGMAWKIKGTQAMGVDVESNVLIPFEGKQILYRDDNNSPLSIVSTKYNIVQPEEVLQFFDSLITAQGYKMSTAGVLYGGKKFWALAETGQAAILGKHDKVKEYILLATACDGSMATTGQKTTIRVVCNNTLTMSTNSNQLGTFKIPHSASFDPSILKQDMGLEQSEFAEFIEKLDATTQRKVTDKEAIDFILNVVSGITPDEENTPTLVEKSATTTKAIFELFKGQGIGSKFETADGTAWGLINSVTEFCDHRRNTQTTDSRLNSTWFGAQSNMKNRALQQALLLAA